MNKNPALFLFRSNFFPAVFLASSFLSFSTPARLVAAPPAHGTAEKQAVVNLQDVARMPAPKNKPGVNETVEEPIFPSSPSAVSTSPASGRPSHVLPLAALPVSPAPLFTVAGQDQNPGGLDPPDTNGAVSPSFIVTTTNGLMNVKDRSGNVLLSANLNNFWAPVLPAGSFSFDHRCRYDPFGQRFIIISSCGAQDPVHSRLLVAVTKTSDPTGMWNQFAVVLDPNQQFWLDFPTLGFNQKWIGVHGDLVATSNSSDGTWAFNKAALYSGTAQFTFLTGPMPTADLAETYDNTVPDLYMVFSFSNTAPVSLFRITGPIGGESLVTVGAVQGQDTLAPGVIAPQMGGTSILPISYILSSCVFRNGSIWTVKGFTPTSGPSRASLNWLQFDANANLQSSGTIDDPTGTVNYGWPSIGVNKNNDFLIGYTRFTADSFPSCAYQVHLAADPAGTTRGEAIYKAGQSFDPNNRWGDYSHTQVDPVDDTNFWTVQETMDQPITISAGWLTWWAEVSPSGVPALTPTPVPTNTPAPSPTNTLTITPTPAPAATWRVASGGTTTYTDCLGNKWSPDEEFNAGFTAGDGNNPISKALPCATDQSLYQNGRFFPSFTYTFPVLPGTYQVTLKFAEFLESAAGNRSMAATINGAQVLSNFDIFSDAGGMFIADDKTFNGISPVNGQIVIAFGGNPNSADQSALVNAIQIIPQPGTVTATPTVSPTGTPTGPTASPTRTATSSPSATATTSPTLTRTPTPGATSTPTLTPTVTPIINVACGTSPVNLALLEFTSLNGNQASENFEVVNNGSTALNLSQVTLKFWIDDTTGQSVVGAVNFAGCNGPGCASVAGVALSAVNFSPACGPDSTHQANWELTLSNTAGGTLAPGSSWNNIQTQIHLANFGSFSNTAAWYSPSSVGGGSTYTNDLHYALYYQGNLVTASGGVPPSCRALPTCTPGGVTGTPTATASPTPTRTQTSTLTATSSRTATASPTQTPTFTATGAAGTATSTATRTSTSTATASPTRTSTSTPTRTPTLTPTAVVGTTTSTPTRTVTSTVTVTPSAIFTPTPSPTGGVACGTSSLALQLKEFGNCGSNQNQENFEVVNTGSSSVTLSDITIKFWADDTSSSPLVGAVNFGGGFGPTNQAVNGVAISTVNFSPACGPDSTHQANWEVTVADTDTRTLGAGVTWASIQTAVHLSSFANFSPGTGFWYSPCAVGGNTTYTNDLHYALYVRGNLVTASGGVPPSCRPLPTCTPGGAAPAVSGLALGGKTPGQRSGNPFVVAEPNISRNGKPIQFQVHLEEPAPIGLDLFSLTGEKVAELRVEGQAGSNILTWDLANNSGEKAASGIYVFVLRSGDLTQTGKVALIH